MATIWKQSKEGIKKNMLYKYFIQLKLDIQLLKEVPFKEYINLKKIAVFLKVRPYTQLRFARLNNVYTLSQNIEKNNIAGAFVECGTWKGGCSAIMAYVAQKNNSKREVWLFDSFEGMPEATHEDGEEARTLARNNYGGKLQPVGTNIASISDVEEIFFKKLHLSRENVQIKKGWFQNTIPQMKKRVGPIAILRLDGDWYESTTVCLQNLYDSVVHGGYVIIDDYGHLPGCKNAVDKFLKERNIDVTLEKIDYTGRFFRK